VGPKYKQCFLNTVVQTETEMRHFTLIIINNNYFLDFSVFFAGLFGGMLIYQRSPMSW